VKNESVQRCRGVYPVQLMCRCLRVSTSGFCAWAERSPGPRERENQRLLERIREHHSASDGVIGVPRMHEELSEEGEIARARTASPGSGPTPGYRASRSDVSGAANQAASGPRGGMHCIENQDPRVRILLNTSIVCNALDALQSSDPGKAEWRG